MQMQKVKTIIKGIYGIMNKETKKVYIGQSKNVSARIATHRTMLNGNNYSNKSKSLKNLQDDYNKYKDNYEFIIIEEAEENLNDLEDQYIEYYRSKNWTVFNVETNKERKIRLSKGIASGHKKSEECRYNYKNSKHLEDNKKQILYMYYQKKSLRYIAEQFNVSHTLIARHIKMWI